MPLSAPVFLEADGVLGRAWAVNVSEGGMLLHGCRAAALAADQPVKVMFRVPESAQPLHSSAQVVGDPRGARAGLRFLSLEPRPLRALSHFVTAAKERPRDPMG